MHCHYRLGHFNGLYDGARTHLAASNSNNALPTAVFDRQEVFE